MKILFESIELLMLRLYRFVTSKKKILLALDFYELDIEMRRRVENLKRALYFTLVAVGLHMYAHCS